MEKRATGFAATVGLLLLLAVGLFFAGPSKRSVSAQPATPTGRSVTVTGEGFVALKPEMVRLHILSPIESSGGPNTLAPIDRITAALRANGVSKDDIHVQGPAVSPVTLAGLSGGAMVVDATLRDPSRLTDAIKAVLGQGGFITDARFLVSKPDQAQNQAVNLALKDALAKAKALASAAGGSVGQVNSVTAERVTEEGASTAISAQAGAPDSGSGSQAAPGYGFHARVQVTYELR